MLRRAVALPFLLLALAQPSSDAGNAPETAVLSGGCFWGVEAVFEHVKGVQSVVSGYSGGSADTARYGIVSSGRTGHAESVQITFDPARVSYAELLKVFFAVAHDPTELDRQGRDAGTQYRSAIFYASEAQKRAAEAAIAALQPSLRRPITTQVVPLKAFYPAESYHQHYLARHPTQLYIVVNDLPKLAALERKFPERDRRGQAEQLGEEARRGALVAHVDDRVVEADRHGPELAKW
jgi:peptide-methionine (S)-S-oxide reductase